MIGPQVELQSRLFQMRAQKIVELLTKAWKLNN